MDSKEIDVKLSWTGLDEQGEPVSGLVDVEVDYDAFEKDQKKEYTEKLALETQVVGAVKDALDFIKSHGKVGKETKDNKRKLLGTTNYDWTTTHYDQYARISAPYGKIYMTYHVKKAHISNGSSDHFFSSHISNQVNPGAQLCKTDSSYACKWLTEREELRIEPKDYKNTPFKMLEHEPVNAPDTGTTGFSIGGGYDGGTWSLSAAFNWEQNWSELE